MKKTILIVASSLSMGGLEKCIISLCNAIDYERYDVDLYLFNDGRELCKELNPHVTLLPDSPWYSVVYNKPLWQACTTLFIARKFSLLFYRFRRFIRARLGRRLNTVVDWEYMQRTMLKIDKHYDVAIGFEECTANYYVTECINADVKDCWIHTDITKIDTNEELDRRAFSKADYICTVSNNSLLSLKQKYPEYEGKYRSFIMPTLIPKETLVAKSKEACIMDGVQETKILSVGRLVELKGFHLCVKALRDLLDRGYDVTWYVAGEGSYRENIEKEINASHLEGRFILLGSCKNPYSLIRSADICVQPSSYEGFSLSVWEEKMLGKAVVVSDIPANHEIIEDRINGIIVKRESEDIRDAVKYLLDHPDERVKMGQESATCYTTIDGVMKKIEETFESSGE